MVYPALLPLMRTPRLPVVDWTDAPRRVKWTLPFRRKTKYCFCACAITFQLPSTNHYVKKTFSWFNDKQAGTTYLGSAGAPGCPLTPVQNPLSQFYFLSQTECRWNWGGGVRDTTVFHITAALSTSATDRSDDMSPNKSLSIPVVSYRASSIPIMCYDRHR